jgi:hypothetical protein
MVPPPRQSPIATRASGRPLVAGTDSARGTKPHGNRPRGRPRSAIPPITEEEALINLDPVSVSDSPATPCPPGGLARKIGGFATFSRRDNGLFESQSQPIPGDGPKGGPGSSNLVLGTVHLQLQESHPASPQGESSTNDEQLESSLYFGSAEGQPEEEGEGGFKAKSKPTTAQVQEVTSQEHLQGRKEAENQQASMASQPSQVYKTTGKEEIVGKNAQSRGSVIRGHGPDDPRGGEQPESNVTSPACTSRIVSPNYNNPFISPPVNTQGDPIILRRNDWFKILAKIFEHSKEGRHEFNNFANVDLPKLLQKMHENNSILWGSKYDAIIDNWNKLNIHIMAQDNWLKEVETKHLSCQKLSSRIENIRQSYQYIAEHNVVVSKQLRNIEKLLGDKSVDGQEVSEQNQCHTSKTGCNCPDVSQALDDVYDKVEETVISNKEDHTMIFQKLDNIISGIETLGQSHCDLSDRLKKIEGNH